jgi:hypothetical protein
MSCPGSATRCLGATSPRITGACKHDYLVAQQDSARASWDALEAPWRVAIEMGWQSYRDGGIAVGAVLTDAAGVVIGALEDAWGLLTDSTR